MIDQDDPRWSPEHRDTVARLEERAKAMAPKVGRCQGCGRRRRGCICCAVKGCIAPGRAGSEFCAYHGGDMIPPRRERG